MILRERLVGFSKLMSALGFECSFNIFFFFGSNFLFKISSILFRRQISCLRFLTKHLSVISNSMSVLEFED